MRKHSFSGVRRENFEMFRLIWLSLLMKHMLKQLDRKKCSSRKRWRKKRRKMSKLIKSIDRMRLTRLICIFTRYDRARAWTECVEQWSSIVMSEDEQMFKVTVESLFFLFFLLFETQSMRFFFSDQLTRWSFWWAILMEIH